MSRKADPIFRMCHCLNCGHDALVNLATHVCPFCGSSRMVPIFESLDQKAIEGRGETNVPGHFANPRVQR